MTPRIYVADLAAYNAGILHGKWIDADEDASYMQDQIDELLRNSPCPNVEVDCPCCAGLPDSYEVNAEGKCVRCLGKGKIPSAEEFAIHDTEDLGNLVKEYTPIEEVAKLAKLRDGFYTEVIEAALEHTDLDGAEEWLSDCYQGSFRTLEDWAEEFLEDTGQLGEMPEALRPYFDFEKWARDAELGGDVFTVDGGEGVHVFWGNR